MEENKTHEGHSHEGHAHEGHSYEGHAHEGHPAHHEAHATHTSAHAAGAGLGPEMNIPKFDTKNLDFQGAFNSVLDILKLNQTAIEQVAKNEKLNFVALIFLVIGSVIGPLATKIFGFRIFNVAVYPSLQDTLIGMIVNFVIAALVIFITTLVATRVFNGKGTLSEYFRIMGLAYILNVLTILSSLVPSLAMVISLVVGVWMLVIEFVSLKAVFKMDATNSALTMIVSLIAFVVLGALLASVGLGAAVNSAQLNSFADYKIGY